MVTIAQIAEKVGVSSATVSYVLNKRDAKVGISEGTRLRVLSTASALGYQPNRAGRALATGKSSLVALWMPHLLSAFYAKMVYSIEMEVRRSAYDLIVSGVRGDDPTSIPNTIALPCHVDGVLAFDTDYPAELANTPGSPAVVTLGVHDANPVDLKTDTITVDLEPGAQAAMRHLLAQGYRRIAFMSGVDNCHENEIRYATYARSMREAGLHPEYIHGSTHVVRSRPMAREVLKAYVAGRGCPEAIFCLNDEWAIGVCRALRELGLKIPTDVAVVGCDGIDDAEYYEPPLSTIGQPFEEMSRLAWRMLCERMEDRSAPLRRVNLTAQFVERESSRRK